MPKAQVSRRGSSHAVAAVGTTPLCSSEYEEKLYNVLKGIEMGSIELPVASRPSKAGAGQPKRPRNSFIVFRSGYSYLTVQEEEARDFQGKTRKVSQQDISRDASVLWKSFSTNSRVYLLCTAMSKGLQDEHQKAYPDYRYAPRAKRDDEINSATASVRPRRKSGKKNRRKAPRYESESDLEEDESTSSDDEEWHPKTKTARGATLRAAASTDSVSNRIARNSHVPSFTLPESSRDTPPLGTPSLVSNTDSPSAWSAIQLPETPETSTQSLPLRSSLDPACLAYVRSTDDAAVPNTSPQTMQSYHSLDEEVELPDLDDRNPSHDEQLARIFEEICQDPYPGLDTTKHSSWGSSIILRQPTPPLSQSKALPQMQPFTNLSYDAASLPLPLPNIWEPSHPLNLEYRIGLRTMGTSDSPILPQMPPTSGAYEDATMDLDLLDEL